MVLEYVLVEWCDDGEMGERVSFRIEDFDGSVKIDRLTDRALTKILRLLEEAKRYDPDGFYLPIAPKPSKSASVSGSEIRVLRDGFFKLRPIFRGMMQELVDEYEERTKRFAS